MGRTRAKVSITVPSDLLEIIDREVSSTPESSRSAVIEAWLRRAARGEALDELEQATAAYYQGLTSEELEEDLEWAAFSTGELCAREAGSTSNRHRAVSARRKAS
jgi:Arc/MetJ-type ribon-helix-helix transcriptional regulator